MIYTKYFIENYKAIEKMEINLSSNVIPLIGVNESGKTSILHAALAFDKDKDNLLNGVHIDPMNKYRTTQNECTLSMYIVFEDEAEFQEIGQELSLSMDNPLYLWLKTAYEEKREIHIARSTKDEVFNNTYTLLDESPEILNAPKIASLLRSITKRLPNILYFDDFSDRVPEEITFPASYPEDEKLSSKGKDREWQNIIVEIFARALDQDFSLKKFLALANEDLRENYLNDVADILDSEIIDEWKKLKQAHAPISEESADLKLKIAYNRENGKHIFKFKVDDSEDSGARRRFDVSLRSKGFQWFFNFIIKLKFNPKYKLHPKNAIYLLDEPGSYLHSSAQTELLKKLCEIGKDNKIIYCTHSQYLLDPEIINIAAIKIVEKLNGKIVLTDYGRSNHIKSLGALTALNYALHLKFGFHEHLLSKCILTEGIIDYYF